VPVPSALNWRIACLAIVAMLAFAANSLLCRLGLGAGSIDAASFASLRMVSGAAVLALILRQRDGSVLAGGGTALRAAVKPALMLFLYMACFSFAYLSLGAGTGALILFGAVQLTMFATALLRGERFSPLSWGGLALAFAGLVYLVLPGLHAPDPFGALLMGVAGLAWGVYSLLGRSAADPLLATARNFLVAVPPILAISVASLLLAPGTAHADLRGVLLALASGALASGCGYVVWYALLPNLSAMRAATLQLSVPAIAALGGVLFLGEMLTQRLVFAALATLGGVAIVLIQRSRSRN
jgi:drug/metabolite transporter (DMT)-like permease